MYRKAWIIVVTGIVLAGTTALPAQSPTQQTGGTHPSTYTTGQPSRGLFGSFKDKMNFDGLKRLNPTKLLPRIEFVDINKQSNDPQNAQQSQQQNYQPAQQPVQQQVRQPMPGAQAVQMQQQAMSQQQVAAGSMAANNRNTMVQPSTAGSSQVVQQQQTVSNSQATANRTTQIPSPTAVASGAPSVPFANQSATMTQARTNSAPVPTHESETVQTDQASLQSSLHQRIQVMQHPVFSKDVAIANPPTTIEPGTAEAAPQNAILPKDDTTPSTMYLHPGGMNESSESSVADTPNPGQSGSIMTGEGSPMSIPSMPMQQIELPPPATRQMNQPTPVNTSVPQPTPADSATNVQSVPSQPVPMVQTVVPSPMYAQPVNPQTAGMIPSVVTEPVEAPRSPAISSRYQEQPSTTDSPDEVISSQAYKNTPVQSSPQAGSMPSDWKATGDTAPIETAEVSPTSEPVGVTANESEQSDGQMVDHPKPGAEANLNGGIQTSVAPGAIEPVVLTSQRSPVLKVETLGPQHIIIGKEAAFRINVSNSGAVSAEQIDVSIRLPAWADVMSTEPTSGMISPGEGAAYGNQDQQLVWKLDTLGANDSQQLLLKLIPRERQPLNMEVNWDYQKRATQASIEVQQPELSLSLEGSREVFWGDTEQFKLHVRNIGNGDAQNVKLTLAALDELSEPSVLNVPLIKAGEDRILDLQLTARQNGFLPIDLTAEGENDLKARLSERIAIRCAELNLAVEAPQLQFVGNRTTYTIRIRNTGNAPAKSINLVASLPQNCKYISNVGGGKVDASGRMISWELPEMAVSVERTFTVTCLMNGEGVGQLDVVSNAFGELTAKADAKVTVSAVADLALEISDPAGPVAVGEDAVYNVTIVNRGTKKAENVAVVASFSKGIDPKSVKGAEYRIGDGMVIFEPLAAVEPGQKVELVIHASAEVPGNHQFLVDVSSGAGVQLRSQEATFFYQNQSASATSQSETSTAFENSEAPTGQF